MSELGFMAGSASLLSEFVFQEDKNLFRAADDWLPTLWNDSTREETTLSTSSCNLKPLQLEESWSPGAGILDSSNFIAVNSSIVRPVLLHIHESLANPALFSYGIEEKTTRHQEIVQFLTSRSNGVEENMLNSTLFSKLIGLQAVTSDWQPCPTAPLDYTSSRTDGDAETWSSFLYPTGLPQSNKPLLDFVGDLAHDSNLAFGQAGQISFTGTRSEMKDLLSYFAEFYLSKKTASLRKKQSVVPYFHRRASRAPRGTETAQTSTPKSPEKVNPKTSSNKSSNKGTKGNNSSKKDYFRACEILLSLMMTKKRHDKTAINLLKKSGPELPELLTQCSASIAGTGVAIIISVVYKLACGRVPMCGAKVLSGGLGLGLVWLSWEVNRLREGIVQVSKNPSKVTLMDEDVMRRVDRNVTDIMVGAGTLMAVALLRLA